MTSVSFVDDSRVSEIMQRVASDRAILYFASGLDETQSNQSEAQEAQEAQESNKSNKSNKSNNFFNNDWCFKMNIANSKVDSRHFALVDQYDNVRYRALLLLDCIRNQFSQGDGRLAALALLRSGTDFDCFRDADNPVCVALRNPFFGLRAEDANNKTMSLEAKDNEVRNCQQLLKNLRIAYGKMRDITDAMGGLIGSNMWYLWQTFYTNNENGSQPIVVSFMVRHTTVESEPEIIITIEHTIVEPDKVAADDFASSFNCDSYVEKEGCEESGQVVDNVRGNSVTLRVVGVDNSDDAGVTFELSSATWDAVVEGFALCFPQYSVTKDIETLFAGARGPLAEGDSEAVQIYIEECATHNITAVFVHELRPGEATLVVAHKEPDHIFRRPQHRVANAMFEMVRARLEEDGQSVEHYKRLQYVILVPKFNSLKQQTKERIEACAELVRDNEDASCLVELYPLTAASLLRIEDLQNQILDVNNSNVLYVFIVDECHYAPSQTAIPILHRPEIQSRLNFIALMVSATPYSCLSERSRVPRNNIIEWSEHIDAADRPNYIGFEYYFRSVTYRLPSWELLLTIDGASVTINLPQYREFADFESLADVVTAQLLGCVELCGSSLRCSYKSSKYTFALKRQVRSGTQSVCIGYNKFLEDLGFTNDIIFPAEVDFTAAAPNEPSIDNGTSVASQHMRGDVHFTELYKTIVAACPTLERISSRIREPELLGGNGSPGPKAAIRPGKTYKPLKHALMADKNGFTIIIDYIFSLAYFGSCRLLQRSDSTTFALLTEVTDQMCNEFLRMLDESCYFDYSSDDARYPSVSCDISRAVKAALDALCNSAKGERPDLVDVPQLVKYILESKVIEERKKEDTSENQAWFTETDRIVWMLLVERKPAPMVLMRVFDKDENRSMQTILRHAMGVCGFVRQRAGRCNVPAFSVITDVSETSLLREIEPYYRDEYNVGDEANPMHVRDIIAQRHQTQTESDTKVPNLDLKYEDLLNVPCLIILCEKGRMGDTFPHTLRALDLRLRTGGTASCFLQEIGRMCRYPKTHDSALVAVDVDALQAYFLDAQPKFGVTVSIPSSNAFLGVAKDADDVRRILAGRGESDTMFHVQLAHFVHPLPYALIDPKVMGSIRRAINKREVEVFAEPLQAAPLSESNTENARSHCKIIKFLKMPRGVDDYLTCQIMREPLNYKLMRSKSHYDFSNTATEKHDRRFLLSAECQVGKTGAYLHLLTLLRHAIEKGDNQQQIVPVAPSIPIGSLWCEWLIPYEANLRRQPSLQYDFPKKGKYHYCIARQRIAQLKMLMADTNNPFPLYERFAACIQEHEQVTTTAGLSRLQALSIIPDGNAQVDYRQYVNWDGRFCRDGVWHEMLNEARSLASLIEEGLDDHIPLAQDVMFGSGAYLHIEDAGDADVDFDAPIQASFGTTFTPVCAKTAVMSASNCVAKSVPAYQLSPRIVPINDSVMVTLSNFFGDATALPRHQLGPSSTAALIMLSVPKDAFFVPPVDGYNFTFNSGAELNALLHQPQAIKSWIFTPSFCGTSVGPAEKLLLRDDAFIVDSTPLTRWVDFGEVLVVRASQLEMYQQFYGGTHIIAALPDTMQFVDADGVVGPVMDASKHGCGFSRRFSQLLAQYMGWQSVWMIDDYVMNCWKLVCAELKCNPNNVTLEPASFAEVMLHIESMFFCRPEASTYPNLDQQIERMVGASELVDVTGAMPDKYGVIGMCRGKQWRSHIAHPIKRSYSVYSFFLLNVNATVGRNLFFPARPIWEDIEFNNLLDENRLLVCKLQVFAHEKLSHAPAEPSPLEPEEVSDLEKFMFWLESNGYYPSSQRKEVLMSRPHQNSFLESVDDYLQPARDPVSRQQPCYISLVHNPGAFQRGAFGGVNRSTCTVQSCVDNILNESQLLEEIVDSVAYSDVNGATWLMVFPLSNAITDLDAPLRTDEDVQRGLCVTYERLVPLRSLFGDMGDAILVVCATVQGSCQAEGEIDDKAMVSAEWDAIGRSTGEGEDDSCLDPIVCRTEAMEIDTKDLSFELDAPSSSTDAKGSGSVKRKRASTAGTSPRKRNGTRSPQDQYIWENGPALLQALDERAKELGIKVTQHAKLKPLKEDIFSTSLIALNELGPKLFTALTMHSRCQNLLFSKREATTQQEGQNGQDAISGTPGEAPRRASPAELGRSDSTTEDVNGDREDSWVGARIAYSSAASSHITNIMHKNVTDTTEELPVSSFSPRTHSADPLLVDSTTKESGEMYVIVDADEEPTGPPAVTDRL